MYIEQGLKAALEGLWPLGVGVFIFSVLVAVYVLESRRRQPHVRLKYDSVSGKRRPMATPMSRRERQQLEESRRTIVETRAHEIASSDPLFRDLKKRHY